MKRRLALIACLVFSGLAALVYQVVWTRLLGFAFGTTSEAIGTVLAVFFGGMALGNLLAARRLERLHFPLRMYAWLELAIGAFALATLPLLQRLDGLYAFVGAEHDPIVMTGIRLAAAAALLLPPTIAMGATLPVVARGLVENDATLGRWSALLYAANTFGAVLGAYTCGFWLVPQLGLTTTVIVAGCINVAVAAAVMSVGGRLRVAVTAPAESLRPGHVREPETRDGRGWFLLFFGISGFVAIGYEIVWSKVFSIVMEGTLYGFTAVLSAYLFGIGLGSLAMARFIDRVRDLPRLFGLLHVGIGASVAIGIVAIPVFPHFLQVLTGFGGTSDDAVHVLLLLAAPLVIVPTALFGAAFPVLIRIYTSRASSVGEGMGVATAVNTTGSIAGSLLVGFLWIPGLGIDGSLYLLLMLDLAVGALVLVGFQSSRGRERLAGTAAAAVVLALVAVSYDGVRVEQAIVGRWLDASSFSEYRSRMAQVIEQTELVAEGRTSIVTVHKTTTGRALRTNGLPEAGHTYVPPYFSLETQLLGVLPYLLADDPQRGLVVGFGGGATVDALTHTELDEIRVVELEGRVIEAAQHLYMGRRTPLHDPRVEVRVNDGRNELLLDRYRGGGDWDVIASQPSHPWVSGAANLFTEEFFALARDALSEGGVFALWVNGFRTDPESVLAIMASFERVLPGGIVVAGAGSQPRQSLILLGGRAPLRWRLETMRERLAEERLGGLLDLYDVTAPETLLARVEGPVAGFAALAEGLSNTDDNAFVETRIPRRLSWAPLDFSAIESRLPDDAQALPPLDESVDVAAIARDLLGLQPRHAPWPFRARVERLLRVHGADVDPVVREVLRAEAELKHPDTEADGLRRLRDVTARSPERPEPLRAVGLFQATQRGEYRLAAHAFGEAWQRSHAARDAYDSVRSWHRLDREQAWAWLDRIPEDERAAFPRLAIYAAERALSQGAPDLRPHFDALESFRDTTQGRKHEGVDALLARLAGALGDTDAARAYADADGRRRQALAEPLRNAARAALGERRLDDAAAALEQALALVPSDERVLQARARLALARRDPAALEDALAELRHWGPSLEASIGAENRWRETAGLAVLPQQKPETIVRRP